MKKTTAVILVSFLLVFVFGGAVAAYTADDVFTALKNQNVPEAYILQAKAYFTANPMTGNQADVIMQHINAALVIADGKTLASQLTSAQRGAIFQELVKAGQVLGLVVTYEGATNYEKGTVYVRDQQNNIVFMITAADVVKQTGFDYSIVLAGLSMLILAAGLTIIVRRRMTTVGA